jgi:hypothetical protein
MPRVTQLACGDFYVDIERFLTNSASTEAVGIAMDLPVW